MFEYTKYYATFETTLNKYWNGFMTPSKNIALDHDSNNVIEIRDAYKRYSPNNVVLQGLNMTVKKGTIYGLLGPSGCGKTSVLNCIAGTSTLDAGTIFVRCRHHRQIGYMPQETALMEKFKISELLHYFGKVYGMDHDTVEERAKYLLSLVNLPPDQFYYSSIASLSGGQLRRVSLLVALIHDPDLLVFDEPTVGLDPITRYSLWEYFLNETERKQKTILITTHYIEEARQSHTIGLMRAGVLLAEGWPGKLLVDYKCPSLEDVFLLLSQNQSKSSSEIKPFPIANPRPPPTFTSNKSYCNLNRLAAQTQKNFYWMKRNLWIVAYILLLPGLLSIMICSMHIHKLKGLRIATVNEELCPNQTTSLKPGCDKDYKVSCLFLQHLRNLGYTVSEYPDMPSGMKALRQGHTLVLVYFSRNYTTALIDFMSSSITAPPGDETLTDCQIQVTSDMTEKVKARQIGWDVRDTFYNIQSELMSTCGYESTTYTSLIREPVNVYGSGQIDFIQNALPGFIFPLVFYLTASFSSTAAAAEKNTGVFRRSLVSGVTKLEMNLAHAVIQVMVSSVQNCLLIVVMYFIFDNSMMGRMLTAFAFVLLTELQGMLFGIFLASIIKKETYLTNIATGTILSLFITSGMMWPVECMVPNLKYLVDFSPVTVAVEAYRSISIRGWGMDNPRILTAFQYNIAAVAILLAVNVVSAKINRTC